MAGLPPGSFHLKQYSGMLQGIFEPTAERKRGSLEQILGDFPDRKFILVGDSGEADLEVYTDIVLANPHRILGIFIRDVTTPETKPFFDQSTSNPEAVAGPSRSRSTPQLVDQSDSAAKRPALPPRRNIEQPADTKSLDNGDLIDLREEEEDPETPNVDAARTPAKPRLPPTKPSKPSSLRTMSGAPDNLEPSASSSRTPSQDAIRRKPVPPVPPRRGSQAKTDSLIDMDPSPSISRTQTEPVVEGNKETMGASSRNKAPPPVPPPRRTNTAASTASSTPTNASSSRPEPAAATKASYPTAAAQAALQYATERLNLSSSPSPNPGLRPTASNQSLGRQSTNGSYKTTEPGMPPAPLPNKREELWRRRWERASEILEDHGVVLGSWRVGSDAQPVCMWLIEEQLKQLQKKQNN